MATNDYSLDPLQAEEEALNLRYKDALSKTLRRSGNSIIDAGYTAYDRVSGEMEKAKVDKERRALSERYNSQLADALRGQDDDVRSLMSSPATRAQGAALMMSRQKSKETQAEMDRLRAGAQGSPGDNGVDYGTAVAYAQSSDPAVAARGKQMLEIIKERTKGHDPKDSMRINPATGGAEPIAGMNDAYRQRKETEWSASNPFGIPYPDGRGGTVMMKPGGQALPASTGAAGSPVAPGPVAPGPGPNTPVRGPLAGSVETLAERVARQESGNRHLNDDGTLVTSKKGAQGVMQLMPATARDPGFGIQPARDSSEAENRRVGTQLLEALNNKYRGNEELVAAAYNWGHGNIDKALAQYGPNWKRALPAETQNYVAKVAQQAPTQQAQQPGVFPQAQANEIRYPQGPVGSTPNPSDVRGYEERMKDAREAEKGIQTKIGDRGSQIRTLDRVLELNKQPTYDGALGSTMATVENFFNPKGQKAVNTQVLTSQIESMIAPILKQYGANPSNRDLESARLSMPQINQSKEARDLIVQHMKRGIQAEYDVNQRAMQAIHQARQQGGNLDPADALRIEWDRYNAMRDQQEAAAGGLPPGAPPQNPPSAGGGKTPLSGAVAAEPTGGGGAWEFAKDLGRNAMALPGALASAGGSAMWDSTRNVLEGGVQLIGQGDREAWKKEKDRQDKRMSTDPAYAQSRIFTDIANPTSLMGGTATSIPKIAAVAALHGAMQPGESWSDQVGNAIKSGVVGTGAGVVSKLIPATATSKSINAGGEADNLLKSFPSFKPTSAQVNPGTADAALARGVGVNEAAALAQTKAITKDLMAKAGIPGEQLTPKAFAEANQALGAEYNKLLPKGISAKVGTQEAAMMVNEIKSNPDVAAVIGKAPTLSAIVDIADKGVPFKIKAIDLHNAWKEVGNLKADAHTSGKIRDMLEQQLYKVLNPSKGILTNQSVEKFKALNKKWGLTRDIERVWRGGGSEGVGEAAGYLNPAKIVTEAGSGPILTEMDDAARLIQRFGVRNHGATNLGSEPTVAGLARDAVQGTVGKIGNAMDIDMTRSPAAAKKAAEVLRILGTRVPGIAVSPQFGEQ